ncbi:hypothetical protein Sdia_60920 [Streptomyces diastaticus subsp. diastaticus]|uniref:Lasso RiPP family leader peptide-containing protein n=1 Tax=Streptomyces diastaticus subsp. diastaticus TaxID=68040 RepID=A0ABQ1CYI8_STRDI|nr:hypothetical protein Sdia_60920 [Streptomyces diastaticus subsp. diastaticus]
MGKEQVVDAGVFLSVVADVTVGGEGDFVGEFGCPRWGGELFWAGEGLGCMGAPFSEGGGLATAALG